MARAARFDEQTAVGAEARRRLMRVGGAEEAALNSLARIVSLVGLLSLPAMAQEGHYGVGHDKWHEDFYSKLIRRDTRTSCCSLTDCRPTQSRMVGDHYEVKVEGEWTPVPREVIQNTTAPDGGAHVCAPRQRGSNRGVVYCVVLPPES